MYNLPWSSVEASGGVDEQLRCLKCGTCTAGHKAGMITAPIVHPKVDKTELLLGTRVHRMDQQARAWSGR
jgi:hypothetical protein